MEDILEDSQLYGQKYILFLACSYFFRWKSPKGYRSGKIKRPKLSFPSIFDSAAKTQRGDEWTGFVHHMIVYSRKTKFFHSYYITEMACHCNVTVHFWKRFLVNVMTTFEFIVIHTDFLWTKVPNFLSLNKEVFGILSTIQFKMTV